MVSEVIERAVSCPKNPEAGQPAPQRFAVNRAHGALLDALIEEIYQAAAVPDRWWQLPTVLAQRLGAGSATLRRLDTSLAISPDSNQVILSIFGPCSQQWVLRLGDFPDPTRISDASRLLHSLQSHLARAIKLAEQQALRDFRLNVAVLGQVGIGAAIIENGGNVLATNPLFSKQSGVKMTVGETMRLLHRRDVTAFRPLLSETLIHGARNTVPLHDSSGTCFAALHLVPLIEFSSSGASTAVLAIVANPAANGMPSSTLLQSLFDLTPTEASIARAVASGQGLEIIAVRNSTSVETVRSHLKRAFSKTGTNRQLELALLVRGFGLKGIPAPAQV